MPEDALKRIFVQKTTAVFCVLNAAITSAATFAQDTDRPSARLLRNRRMYATAVSARINATRTDTFIRPSWQTRRRAEDDRIQGAEFI